MGRLRERGLINLLTVKYSNLFKKDYKLMKKRGHNLELLHEIRKNKGHKDYEK